jgi:hypothetical protein
MISQFPVCHPGLIPTFGAQQRDLVEDLFLRDFEDFYFLPFNKGRTRSKLIESRPVLFVLQILRSEPETIACSFSLFNARPLL